MSRAIEHHHYFGELVRDEYGWWTGNLLFEPTKQNVQIIIPGDEKELTVPSGCVSFFEDLVSLYPEISKAIQEYFYTMRDEFEDLKSMDDVWTVFQLEGIQIGVGDLINCPYWVLAYGTDYGGHIFDFEMNGKNVVNMGLAG